MATETTNMFRKTVDPQRVDDPRADAEWRADPGLGNILHGVSGTVSTLHHPHPSSSPSTSLSFTFASPFIQIQKTHKHYTQSQEVDRSYKAAPKPDAEFDKREIIHGEGSRGVKGWTGDGKGWFEHKPKPKDPNTGEKIR
jgi:hypothetical protein